MIRKVACFVLCLLGSVCAVEHPQHPVLEWLVDKRNGFVSDKIYFQNGGMFTSQEISQGDHIMTVPETALLRNKHVNEDDSYQGATYCEAAERLAEEYDETSKFWPYVKYIFQDFPHRNLPMAWSNQGQEVLMSISGTEIEPNKPIVKYMNDCVDMNDPEDAEFYQESADILEAAWRIVMARSWENEQARTCELVPGYDQFNHRNGHWNNVMRSNHPSEKNGYVIVAKRDIAAGEQLYNSYSICNENEPACANTAKTFGTQHLVWEYGFLESFPRRWMFLKKPDQNEYQVVFEQDQDDTTGEISIEWLSDELPSNLQIEWMQGQLNRLEGIANNVTMAIATLEHDYEVSLALDYYEALKFALSQAIGSSFKSSQCGSHEDSTCTTSS